jgi:hypothetical protein
MAERSSPVISTAAARSPVTTMIDSAELEAALRANYALIVEAQAELTRYLTKEIEAPALIDNLLALLDGTQQREAKELADIALTVPTFQRVVR